MAVVGNQSKEFEKLRKNLNKVFNDLVEEASKITDNIGNALIELAVNNCKARLSRATPKDSESASLIKTIENNIVKNEFGSSGNKTFTMTINPDPENLYLFLEYGTGLVGENNKLEDQIKDSGWGYAVRRDSYITKSGKTGWFFPKTWTYLDANDENPVILRQKYISEREWVTEYTRKSKYGKEHTVKTYSRVRPHGPKETTTTRTYPKWVFSEGLKPIRYFYDTKDEMGKMVNQIAKQADYGERILGDVFLKEQGTKKIYGVSVKNQVMYPLKDWENAVISAINKRKL